MPRILALGFLAMGSLFIAIGGGMAIWQQVRLARATPVPANVHAARVVTSDSDGTTMYRPVVEFSYVVAGRTYQADTPVVLATSSSSSRWANDVVAAFPPGPTTAYVDRADPARAFLLREPDFFPYVFVLFPMVHLTAGLAMLLLGRSGIASTHERARSVRLLTLIWNGVGALTLSHYLLAGGAAALWPILAFALYAVIGLALLWAWIAVRGRSVGPARLAA